MQKIRYKKIDFSNVLRDRKYHTMCFSEILGKLTSLNIVGQTVIYKHAKSFEFEFNVDVMQ